MVAASLYIPEKIPIERTKVGEDIWFVLLRIMPMVTLAALIVVPDQRPTLLAIIEPVLEAVLALGQGLW
ncbi:MAG: hypothetical protein JXL84_16730 [Deltaproteobacteria bacterium]|nr:hypothetical protein [Deltaproteobacteria bacterium]